MINAHDLTPTVGPDAYASPIGEMDKVFLDKYDAMINLLNRLVNSSDRAREKAAPDVIDLSVNKPTYATKTGLRVIGLVISGQPTTDNIRITVGLRPYNFWSATGNFIEFPIEITNGIDLTAANITTPASTTWTVYVFGYPF